MKVRRGMLAVALIFMLLAASLSAAAAEMVNMEFKQAPLVDVFQILGQLGGYNVLVDPSVTGQVTFALKNLTVEEALDLVTRTTGYRYKLMGNTLVIGTAQRLKTEFGTEDFRFVEIKHVQVEAAQRLVSLVAPGVKAYVDHEQGLLVLFGLTSDLDLASKILSQYDQKSFTAPEQGTGQPPQKEENLISGAAPVFYGEGQDVLEAVRQRWPLREFRWDDKSNSIIGETGVEEWMQIKAFVAERDLPNFILKGLLTAKGQTSALVEYRGVAQLVHMGDVLHDWQVDKIAANQVEFSLGERKLIIRMGR